MARFLAIPFVLAISMAISLLPLGGESTPQTIEFYFITFFYLLPIAIFVGALSMTSIGQEGYAVWNIYAAPIKPKQILQAKVVFAASLGLVFGGALLIVFAVLLNTVITYFATLLMLGFLAVLEVSALGVYFAARFPDFREMVRSRYVGVWGSLLGLGTALAASWVTAVPAALSMLLYNSVVPIFALGSLLVGLVIFAAASKLANRQMIKLFQNVPT